MHLINYSQIKENSKVLTVLHFYGLRFLKQQVICEWVPIQLKVFQKGNDSVYLINDNLLSDVEQEPKITDNNKLVDNIETYNLLDNSKTYQVDIDNSKRHEYKEIKNVDDIIEPGNTELNIEELSNNCEFNDNAELNNDNDELNNDNDELNNDNANVENDNANVDNDNVELNNDNVDNDNAELNNADAANAANDNVELNNDNVDNDNNNVDNDNVELNNDNGDELNNDNVENDNDELNNDNVDNDNVELNNDNVELNNDNVELNNDNVEIVKINYEKIIEEKNLIIADLQNKFNKLKDFIN